LLRRGESQHEDDAATRIGKKQNKTMKSSIQTNDEEQAKASGKQWSKNQRPMDRHTKDYRSAADTRS